MRRPRIALIVASIGILLVAPPARGDDAPAEPEAIAAVRSALAEYDEAIKSGGADSVAAEKAVLSAGTSPAYASLVEFLSHERFGPLVLHALCAHGTDALGAKGLAAYLAWPAARRVEGALEVASARTDAVRAALKALAADDAVAKDEALSTLVGAARVRAGDPESLALLDKALASKDPSIVAHGLLLAGDARATTLLARIGRFVDDKRPLPKAVRSKWSDTKTTTTSDGTTTSNTLPVELGTLGEVALEAANRMCATTVPDWVAWWYEPEKGPRFGRGVDGARLLKAAPRRGREGGEGQGPARAGRRRGGPGHAPRRQRSGEHVDARRRRLRQDVVDHGIGRRSPREVRRRGRRDGHRALIVARRGSSRGGPSAPAPRAATRPRVARSPIRPPVSPNSPDTVVASVSTEARAGTRSRWRPAMTKTPAYDRARRRQAARPVPDRAPRAGPHRRRDRHPVLRRLPLRPPPGARRVGRARSSRWSPATRSSAGSPPVGAEVTRFKVGRPRRRRLHGRLLPHLRPCRARPRAVLREGRGLHLQRHRDGPRDADLRRLLAADRGRPSTSSCRSPPSSTRPPPRRCSAPASPPTRRCATGAQARADRSASSASAASATWRVKLAQAMGAEVDRLHHVAGQGGGRAPARRRRRSSLTTRRADVHEGCAGSFDLILDTVSAPHDLNAYLGLLQRDGTLVAASACPTEPTPVAAFALIMRRRRLAGLADRRHRRDPGDARLLRRARHRRPTSR